MEILMEENRVMYDEPKRITLLLPNNPEKIKAAKMRDIIVLAIWTAQNKNEHIRTQNELCEKVKKLTDSDRVVSQSQVSRIITDLGKLVINIKGESFVLRSDNEGYCFRSASYLEEEAYQKLKNDLIKSKKVFRNNRIGQSTIYGYKIPMVHHEDAKKQFVKMLPSGCVFGFISKQDVLFVLLNADASTADFAKATEKLLRFSKEEYEKSE